MLDRLRENPSGSLMDRDSVGHDAIDELKPRIFAVAGVRNPLVVRDVHWNRSQHGRGRLERRASRLEVGHR